MLVESLQKLIGKRCFNMEIKIIKKIDNPFFKRKDLRIDIIHRGAPTPKTDDLKKELGKMYKVDESQVSVDYILTKRGIGESIAKIKILNEKPVIVKKSAEKPTEKKGEETKGEPKEAREKPKEHEKEHDAKAPEVKEEIKKEGGETETQTSKA